MAHHRETHAYILKANTERDSQDKRLNDKSSFKATTSLWEGVVVLKGPCLVQLRVILF